MVQNQQSPTCRARRRFYEVEKRQSCAVGGEKGKEIYETQKSMNQQYLQHEDDTRLLNLK